MQSLSISNLDSIGAAAAGPVPPGKTRGSLWWPGVAFPSNRNPGYAPESSQKYDVREFIKIPLSFASLSWTPFGQLHEPALCEHLPRNLSLVIKSLLFHVSGSLEFHMNSKRKWAMVLFVDGLFAKSRTEQDIVSSNSFGDANHADHTYKPTWIIKSRLTKKAAWWKLFKAFNNYQVMKLRLLIIQIRSIPFLFSLIIYSTEFANLPRISLSLATRRGE